MRDNHLKSICQSQSEVSVFNKKEILGRLLSEIWVFCLLAGGSRQRLGKIPPVLGSPEKAR